MYFLISEIILCKIFALKFSNVNDRVCIKLYLVDLPIPLHNFNNGTGRIIKSIFALVLNVALEERNEGNYVTIHVKTILLVMFSGR